MVRFLGGILGKDHTISFPIGLERDGEVLLKPYCPPYYPSMEAAVHAVVKRKFGAAGVLRGGTKDSSFKKPDAIASAAPSFQQETIDATVAYFTYLHENYNHFPGLLGSVSDEHRIPGSSPRPGLLRASLPARGLERQAAGTHAQLAPRSPYGARTMSSRGHALRRRIARRSDNEGRPDRRCSIASLTGFISRHRLDHVAPLGRRCNDLARSDSAIAAVRGFVGRRSQTEGELYNSGWSSRPGGLRLSGTKRFECWGSRRRSTAQRRR